MLDQTSLTYNCFRVLHATYWVIAEVLNALENAIGKANEAMRFHLMLASKRCSVIIEHLRIALKEAGIEPNEKLEEEELRRRIGVLPLETLENIKSTLKGLINDFALGKKSEGSWLASKLTEFADMICIIVGLFKAFSESLKENQNEHIWRTRLILQTVAQDLEIIANAHRFLASNPEMLTKDLKLNHN